MDLQQYLVDISLKTMSQIHRAIVHLTGGQVLGSAGHGRGGRGDLRARRAASS